MIKIICLILFFQFQFKAFGQNYTMGIPDGRDSVYDLIDKKAILNEANYRDVGSSFSLKKYAPTPGNQGDYGTCAAWATTYCARTILESINNEENNKQTITNNAYSPGFIYRLASKASDCNGSFITNCAERIKTYGVPKLTEFDIDCPLYLPQNLFDLAQDHKIKAYAKLFDNTLYNSVSDKVKVQLVKKSISEKYPVVIGIICPNSFQAPIGDLWLPTEDLNSEINHKHGRHALCVVGYDDEKYGGAFEIQNSWGTEWGDGGYIWIKYSDFAKFTFQAIEMIGYENYQNQKLSISGGLKILLSDGEFVTATYKENGIYQLDKSLSSGERFRLYLNSSSSSFLYSVNINGKGEINRIFPFQEGISPFLSYKNNDVPIPSEDKQMRLDGIIGKESLCLIYSKKQLDFEELISKLKGQSNNNSIVQKFQNYFGENLVNSNEINYQLDSKGINFNATITNDDVIVIILEIDHVE